MRTPDWQTPDGTIQLFLADCAELLQSMPDKSVDITCTSPPFNTLQGEVNQYGLRATRGSGTDKWLEKVREFGYEDHRPEREYQSWLARIVGECLRLSKGLVWVNHKPRGRDGELSLPERFLPFRMSDMVVWNRRGSIAQNCGKFPPSFEFLLGFGERDYWDSDSAKYLSVWDDIAPARGFDDHPCPWPVAIPERLIRATCNPGGIVFEPFAGRGSTAIACMRLGRGCIAVEKRPDYFAAMVKNIEAELGRCPLFEGVETVACGKE